MIKLLLKSCLILALITSLSKADQITTGNLLPNAGQGASSAQSVDNSIDKIGNTFSNFTSNNATNFSSEVEVTGTGTLSYSGTLLDITTGNDTTNQNKLDNGITLQGNTIIQNCEWASSSYACGNRGSGRDSYSTKIQILDSNNSLLSETNQIRNNDAGYGSTAFKYTDTLIFNNVGSNKFNWEWTGIDGQANPGNLGGPNLLGANLFMIYDNTEIEESITQELHSISKNLTESVRMVIIEEEVIEIKAAPMVNPNTPMITAAPVATTQTITTAKLPPPTPLPSTTPKAAPQPTATTTSAPPANTQPASPAPTNTNKPTQKLTQKTNTPTKTTSTTKATNNAPKSTSSSTATTNSKTKTASKSNETKKTEEKKSNSSPTKTTTTKKESNKEQKTVQSKSGETKTADAKSQSGSVEPKEAVSLDAKMAKVDTDIKDIGKNLEIKNVIKLQAMVNNEMINVYNVPFYKEKLLYTDQLNIFDKPIYQNVNLGSYILNDPIVKSKINIIRIKKQKQKLLNEIEVLKNG